MPNVVPVQAMSCDGSTRCRVDVIVPGPDFQRNFVPSRSGPPSDADLTSGFQLGHAATSLRTSHTIWGEAATSISRRATAGAVASISMTQAYGYARYGALPHERTQAVP